MSAVRSEDFFKQYPPPWSWDDEDRATVPSYIHIYSDGGAVLTLDYQGPAQRETLAAFADAICRLVNEGEK